MDFELDDEVTMIRDMMRRFVEKDARPLEMPLFNEGELTPEQEDGLKEKIRDQMGLWAVTVPEEYGGEELDALSTCLIEEELGQTFVPVDYGDIPGVLFACSEEQSRLYLEPAVEGDRRPVLALREPAPTDRALGSQNALTPEGWRTTARADGDEYVLSGHKLLGRNPREEDFYVVFARMAPPGRGVTAFLVEPDVDGVRVNEGPEIVLDECRLPSDAVLGEVGGGLGLGVEYLDRQQVKMGARYVGIAQRLLEMSTQYAKDWVSMGQPLALRPGVMRMVAEMASEVQAARLMVYHAAWLLDEERDTGHQAAMVRLFTGQMMRSVMDKTIMVHGGTRCLEREPALRMYRNLVPDRALELGLENSRMAVANHYLELETLLSGE